jgi:hypothetical protein
MVQRARGGQASRWFWQYRVMIRSSKASVGPHDPCRITQIVSAPPANRSAGRRGYPVPGTTPYTPVDGHEGQARGR